MVMKTLNCWMMFVDRNELLEHAFTDSMASYSGTLNLKSNRW